MGIQINVHIALTTRQRNNQFNDKHDEYLCSPEWRIYFLEKSLKQHSDHVTEAFNYWKPELIPHPFLSI